MTSLHTFHWRDLNPFAKPPTVKTLMQEELDELQRALYLEDKQADHHRAQAEATKQRIFKLKNELDAYPK